MIVVIYSPAVLITHIYRLNDNLYCFSFVRCTAVFGLKIFFQDFCAPFFDLQMFLSKHNIAFITLART
jgi:hypothetical protein